MNKEKELKIIEKKINIKHLYIYMDEVISNSLNEGNVHFFITINFQKEIKKKKELNEKIKELKKNLDRIELISWYNIVSELNKNNNYHLHLILAIKSLIGYNKTIEENIKYFLINEYEIDTKLEVCWSFIDIKKTWRYLYKDMEEKKEDKKIKKIKAEKKRKYNEYNEYNDLDPKFESENNLNEEKYNYNYEKKEKKLEIKKENENKQHKEKKNINIIKVEKNQINFFNNIKKILYIEEINDKNFGFIKGVKMEEKSYSEKQLFFLWDFFLLFNNMVIYKKKIYIKIEKTMISYKEFSEVEYLFNNINEIFFFFKKNFVFQFNNFDELNFNIKYVKNKNEKIERFMEFTGRKINFNFNIMEFNDGIYSILYNKYIRTKKFDKNYETNLKQILTEKEIFTIKYYNLSYEHLKEPETWLKSIEKVLGLKKRTESLSDKIANFIKEDDIKWLLIYIAYIFHYSTNELNKKSTLYIWGPSNTGKTTLIINLFINYFGKENIGLISNNKNFEYQHIINKNLLIFDEFDINKINIENFKKLVSKELILGEKKGKEPELIKPTPILISSNYNLENKLNFDENKEAILNRLKTINFREKININEMEMDISKKINEEEAKIIIYCNRVYFNWIKKGSKTRMDDIKLLERI